MPLRPLANRSGIVLGSTGPCGTTSTLTLDATGESFAGIGRVFLEGGSGTKTISSSGGKIYFRAGSVTFANAATTVQVGIKNVSATTGLETGAFQVSNILQGGTDTINANAVNIVAMDTSSMDVSHGDTIAVCIEMLTRGGADSVGITRMSGTTTFHTGGFPYTTADTGSGVAKTTNVQPLVLIEFDDGTVGWLEPFYLCNNFGGTAGSTDFNSGNSPDEYAAAFQVPFACKIGAAGLGMGSLAAGAAFELILYEDPLGTPRAVQTISPDEDLMSASSGPVWVRFSPAITLRPNKWYALALRPTTANNQRIIYWDLGSGNEKMKRPTDFGENIRLVGRTNQTGAFSTVQTYYLPALYLLVSHLHDGQVSDYVPV